MANEAAVCLSSCGVTAAVRPALRPVEDGAPIAVRPTGGLVTRSLDTVGHSDPGGRSNLRRPPRESRRGGRDSLRLRRKRHPSAAWSLPAAGERRPVRLFSSFRRRRPGLRLRKQNPPTRAWLGGFSFALDVRAVPVDCLTTTSALSSVHIETFLVGGCSPAQIP